MTITEFAKSRNVSVNTVSKYIREHEEFKGLIKAKGKSRILSDEALVLLDKKYPLPRPVQIIKGIPEEEHLKVIQDHLRIINEKDKKIEQLQDTLFQIQTKRTEELLELGELRNKVLFLEQKEAEVKQKSFWSKLFKKS